MILVYLVGYLVGHYVEWQKKFYRKLSMFESSVRNMGSFPQFFVSRNEMFEMFVILIMLVSNLEFWREKEFWWTQVISYITSIRWCLSLGLMMQTFAKILLIENSDICHSQWTQLPFALFLLGWLVSRGSIFRVQKRKRIKSAYKRKRRNGSSVPYP